jgi:hypothetical protein
MIHNKMLGQEAMTAYGSPMSPRSMAAQMSADLDELSVHRMGIMASFASFDDLKENFEELMDLFPDANSPPCFSSRLGSSYEAGGGGAFSALSPISEKSYMNHANFSMLSDVSYF